MVNTTIYFEIISKQEILRIKHTVTTSLMNTSILKGKDSKLDFYWNTGLHNKKGKGSRNTNTRLSLGQITMKPVDITREKSEYSKLTEK
jgi:hypothetical protein